MENKFYMFLNEKARCLLTHLKMNMNKMSSEKNIATLSIVRSITNNWRLRFGIKRTSFRIRNKRNVRKTLRPELPSPSPKNCWPNSKTLSNEIKLEISLVNWFLRLWLASPQYDDDTIENIEAIGNISKRSFGNHLQQHLNRKYARKYNVAGLNNCCELCRLVVIFNTHRQCVN